MTPAGVVTEFPVSTGPLTWLREITAGPDGNLWFTEGPSTIGRITPAGEVTKFWSGSAEGITAGPDGSLWFAVPGAAAGGVTVGGAIGRMNPSGGEACDFRLGLSPQSSPLSITAGPDGNLWFTGTDRVGYITPSGCPVPPQPAPWTPPATPVGEPLPTLRIAGPRSVRRGGRARFVYRIRNNGQTAIRGVVVTNTLPQGLGIDAASRKANLKVKTKSLRFTGAGRKVTFRIGTIGAGRTVTLRVNATVARKAATGKRKNVLNMARDGGIGVISSVSRVVIT